MAHLDLRLSAVPILRRALFYVGRGGARRRPDEGRKRDRDRADASPAPRVPFDEYQALHTEQLRCAARAQAAGDAL